MLNSEIFGEEVFVADVSASALEAAINDNSQQNASGFLILCCDEDSYERSDFDNVLRGTAVPVFGGIFPGIIYKGAAYEAGMLIIPVYIALTVKAFENLPASASAPYDIGFDEHNISSLLVFVDGLSKGIGNALKQIFQRFGQSIQVFGGGAGSLSFEQKPCLFTPNGMLQDAMVLVAMEQHWSLAIGHGWEALDGPFLANQVDDNEILQINFQPALDVYKQVVEGYDGREINEDNFFEIAKNYPFGLERLDQAVLVRDPITFSNKALVCVGLVPENTMLYILKGQADNLINAATQSITTVCDNKDIKAGLIFDCISRKMFLGEDFKTEVANISDALGDTAPCYGALVLGEIASGHTGGIDLHNKTAVTAVAN